MNEGDASSVAEYVASLQPTWPEPTLEGDAALGARSYQVCASCHGSDGMGKEELRAPPIVQLNDWYLAQELNNFRIGARGVHPEDASGAMMRPNAVALSDEAVTNVVAYIQTLRRKAEMTRRHTRGRHRDPWDA